MKTTCHLLASAALLFVLGDCASPARPTAVDSSGQEPQHGDRSKTVVHHVAKPPSSESDKDTLRLTRLYRNNDKELADLNRTVKKLTASEFFDPDNSTKTFNDLLESIRKLLPEKVTPLTPEQLDGKVPHSYYFDYGFEPQPGKRLWRRIDNQTWHEIYPDGLTTVFKVLGHTNVSNTEGTIVVKWKGAIDKTFTPNDGGLQAFIPDLGSATMHHWYRNTARGDQGWNNLGPMKDVK